MNNSHNANALASHDASVLRNPNGNVEQGFAKGRYTVECFRDGKLLWDDEVINAVCTEGKDVLLNALNVTPSASVGPFCGLVSSTPTCVAADTMVSHAGWTEVTNLAARGTPAWNTSSANSKIFSSALSITITGTVTVGGCFIVFYTGAVSTVSNTSGKLWSCGAFSGGNKSCVNNDVLQISYTTTL